MTEAQGNVREVKMKFMRMVCSYYQNRTAQILLVSRYDIYTTYANYMGRAYPLILLL